MLLLEYFKPYGDYLVSNTGRVVGRSGAVLKQRAQPKGYRLVTLALPGRPFVGEFVHRLVASLFVPNPTPETRTQVDHIDGNPANNFADNLRWVTQNENIAAKYARRRRLGFRLTERERAAKLAFAKERGKPVVLAKGGKVMAFPSIKAADRFLGGHRRMRHALKDGRKTVQGWRIVGVSGGGTPAGRFCEGEN